LGAMAKKAMATYQASSFAALSKRSATSVQGFAVRQ
jgi:roadblock/LC7 domain-containing protein